MKIATVGFVCSFVLVVSNYVWAGALVKSVDANGNVTYSSSPTIDAETSTDVYIESGPSAKQIDEAQQQAKKTIDQADEAQKKRDKSVKKKSTKRKSVAKKKPSSSGREYADGDSRSSRQKRPVASGSRSPRSGADHRVYTPQTGKPAVLPIKK